METTTMARLSYSENTPKTSSSVSKVGRPTRGSEQWRQDVATLKPMTESEYHKSIVISIIEKGGCVYYGMAKEGKFIPLTDEEIRAKKRSNCMKAVVPGEPKPMYMDAKLFRKNYETYKKSFENWQKMVVYGTTLEASGIPFVEYNNY
jgi:hypothetical protein